MKTRTIIASLALLVGLSACRTQVASPAYIVRVRAQGMTPIKISAVDTLQVDWNPHNPALHFPVEPDMTFDGGVMTHISTTSTAGGDFIVDYPASYVAANATMGTLGFTIDLPYFSRDSDAGTGIINPLVTVRVLDPTHVQIASGAAYATWPLVGGQNVLVAVTCDTGHEAACNPP